MYNFIQTVFCNIEKLYFILPLRFYIFYINPPCLVLSRLTDSHLGIKIFTSYGLKKESRVTNAG